MTAGKHILIVEDNDDLASLYRHYLIDEYRIRLAQTGQEAIRKATPAIDLILLDYKLPDILGTAVRDQLHANGLTTPVVMISGVDPEVITDYGDSAALLTKPLYKEKLQKTVREILTE